MIMSRNDWVHPFVTQWYFCESTWKPGTLVMNKIRVRAKSIFEFGLSHWGVARVLLFFFYYRKKRNWQKYPHTERQVYKNNLNSITSWRLACIVNLTVKLFVFSLRDNIVIPLVKLVVDTHTLPTGRFLFCTNVLVNLC